MPYLGKTPSQGVRARYQFTPDAGATSVSGADANGSTMTFTDGNYVDVYLNGVMLKAGTDYNTNTANTIASLVATVASDVVDVIVYDTFSLFGGTLEGNVTVNNGTFNVDGVVTANAGVVVDEMTIDGDTITATDDFIIDAEANITLNANGRAIVFADDTVSFGHIQNLSGGMIIECLQADKDIYFYGSDGGSSVLALKLDMSEAGDAQFNRNVGIGGTPNNYSGYSALTLNHATNGGVIDLELNGTLKGEIFLTSSALNIKSIASNEDILFQGNDGGSAITALTLDMSEAGAATFNSTVIAPTATLSRSSSNSPNVEPVLLFDNTDSAIGANENIGSIRFITSAEGSGGDAHLESGRIACFSESGHGSTLNASSLAFYTASSEAASEKMRLDSSGRLLLGTTTEGYTDGDNFTIGTSASTGMTIRSGTSHLGNIYFSDGTSGDAEYRGLIRYNHSDDSMLISVNAGARMGIDSSGAITKPTHPAFQARPSSVQTNVAVNTTTTIAFGTEIFDLNGNFASNTFTAPVTGKYQLSSSIFMQHINTDYSYLEIIITTSNRTYINQISPSGLNIDNNASMSVNHSVLADMDASDTAIITINLPNNGSAQLDIHTYSSFSGYLVA